VPSSISSSDPVAAAPRNLARRTAILLVTIVLCTLVVELGMRAGFSRISRIGKRTHEEYLGARSLKRESNVSPVLLAGNSLLLEGVDMPTLEGGFPREVHPVRYIVEQTEYYDWFYGLKRLFAEGSRPAMVVLCIGPTHFVGSLMLLDSGPYYLYSLGDLPAIARLQHLSLTDASSLYFAHWSFFFSEKNALRNFVMGKIDPVYGTFLHELGMQPAPPMTAQQVTAIATPRFAEIDELCRRNGARFVYLIPPGFVTNEDALRAAAADAHVPFLAPVRQSEWPLSKFRDGFHLTPESSIEFARLLAPELVAVEAGKGTY
jgi:hypothetical protein